MKYTQLGRTGLTVSRLALGCMSYGDPSWRPWILDARAAEPFFTSALDAGITFFDTAPFYGDDGFGESLMADFLRSHRDEIVLTTKCGYDLSADARRPAQQRERPHDWRPESIRRQCDDSLRRLGIDVIDLYQLHNTRIEPILDDDLWACLEDLRSEGKVRHLGVALGPAIGWVEEGLESIRQRPICSLQTVYNVLEQEPGRTFAAQARESGGEVGLISRVPHASDSLSGKVTRDTKFPAGDHRAHRNRDNMLDNFEKAETLGFLWSEGTGRTIGQAAVAGILANPAFCCVIPTVLSVEDVREYAAGADRPLTADESTELAARWDRNFDHVDRYVMPLKSSV